MTDGGLPFETFRPGGTLGRETPAEVVLVPRLRDLLLPQLVSGEVDVEGLDFEARAESNGQ